jgi:hypothetical protein
MSAIWRRDADEWRPLLASNFANEEALHDLVEEAPHLLPLSGDPALVVVGREVALGSGYADLVACTQPREVLTLRESRSLRLILPVGAVGGWNGSGGRPKRRPSFITPRAR